MAACVLGCAGCSLSLGSAQPLIKTPTSQTRQVIALAFTQEVSHPDKFTLRADDWGGVAVDHQRGLLYVGGASGVLNALDESTGKLLWRVKTAGPLGGKPYLVDADRLLIATDDGLISLLDLNKREAIWTYRSDGLFRNPPVVEDGLVVLASSRNQVLALDLETGQWRWQFQRQVKSDFTIHGRAGLTYLEQADAGAKTSHILTGFDDGTVASLDLATGEPSWLTSLASDEPDSFSDVDTAPVVSSDRQSLAIGSVSSGVVSLSLQDGSQIWAQPYLNVHSLVSTPGRGYLAVSATMGLLGVTAGGELRWRTPLDPGVARNPIVIGDLVVVGHSESGLLVFDVDTGELLAQSDFPQGISGQLTYDPARNRLYGMTNAGRLYAFDLLAGSAQRSAT